MEQSKPKTWRKKRHGVVFGLLRWPLGLYCKWRYGITVERFREQKDRAYLILMNHQTAFDQFFVAMAFRRPIYFLATEDIFSLGWISDVLRWLVAPIPIKKQTTDVQAVMNCIRVAREGGTVALAPEGNRTYDGRTVYMNPAIAGMAKKMKLPIVCFRIEGGYGVQPRWADKLRKGKMRGYVSRVIEPEEYADMTKDQLYGQIKQELWVDENAVTGAFYSKHSAEYLDRVMYVCPDCGLASFDSRGDIIECKTCGRKIRYLPTKELEGVDKPFPFRFIGQWYDHQCDYVNSLDLREMTAEPLFRDRADVSEVIVYKKKNLLKEHAQIALYGDRIEIDGKVFHFDTVSAVTVLGKNKANIYHENGIWQLKGDRHFNALKYVNFFHRYKNIIKGDEYGKFLGL